MASPFAMAQPARDFPVFALFFALFFALSLSAFERFF